MGIGDYLLPTGNSLDCRDASELRDLGKLFFPGQVVADVVKMNLPFLCGGRVFDEKGNGDWGAAAGAENFATFFTRGFALGALIPPQVEDVETREFFRQALAEAVGGVGFHEAGVGYEADDAARASYNFV